MYISTQIHLECIARSVCNGYLNLQFIFVNPGFYICITYINFREFLQVHILPDASNKDAPERTSNIISPPVITRIIK